MNVGQLTDSLTGDLYEISIGVPSKDGTIANVPIRVHARSLEEAGEKALRKYRKDQGRKSLLSETLDSLSPVKSDGDNRSLKRPKWRWLPSLGRTFGLGIGGYRPGSLISAPFRKDADKPTVQQDADYDAGQLRAFHRNATISVLVYLSLFPIAVAMLAVGLRGDVVTASVLGYANVYVSAGLMALLMSSLMTVRSIRDRSRIFRMLQEVTDVSGPNK